MKKLILVLLLSGCAHGSFSFQNDLLGSLATQDKNYTQGTHLGYHTETEDEKTSYSINQTIYTPSTKKPDADPEILKNDRPYSGWLYGEYRKDIFHSTDLKDTLGIQLGCLGSCSFARQTQQEFHRLINQGIPAWTTAWSLKSEPGILVFGERAKQLWAYKNNVDFSIYGGAKAGNVVDSLSAGFDVRAGFNLDNFSYDPIVFKEIEPPWIAYLFSRIESRYVAYNHHLEGSWITEERHTVNPERVVEELNLGATFGYKDFTFTYRFTIFSSEWEEIQGSFSFGSVSLDW